MSAKVLVIAGVVFVLALLGAGVFYISQPSAEYEKIAPSIEVARNKMTEARAKAIQAECALEAENDTTGSDAFIQECIERRSKE